MILLASCNKTEHIGPEDRTVRFDLCYPSVTKATDGAFEVGDCAGVYMTKYSGETPSPLQVSGGQINNAALTFDGSHWTSNPTTYWDADCNYDVYGYYPFIQDISSIEDLEFSIASDQSTPRDGAATLGGYEVSDFLWAKATGVAYPDIVSLQFRHIMSRLVVNLVKGPDFEGEIPESTIVRIHATVGDALIDLEDGVVIKNPYSAPVTLTAKRLSETQFATIIVPQKVTTLQPVVEVLSKGVSYLVEMRMDFKQGISHSINVTLDSDPAKVKIEIGGEIEGWEQ